jgi:ADP-ribosylglycohydrolase
MYNQIIECVSSVDQFVNNTENCVILSSSRTANLIKKIKFEKKIEKRYITTNYYDWCASVAELQANYSWDGSCQGTVPPALQCFFESDSFEDAIRNAISIGGDSDTIGAITGSVAEAYYGIPEDIKETAKTYIPEDLLQMVTEFENALA